MVETITFNVGGQYHEVSRSLLEMYPDTMLSKLVSKHWSDTRTGENAPTENSIHGDVLVPGTNKDIAASEESTGELNSQNHDSAVFIDRDGQLFRFVLNYLRDGKVVLPIALDINTFFHELSFYGIEVKDEDYSNVSINMQANAQSVMQINGLITSLEKEECCIRFARLCIMQFKEKGTDVTSSNGHSQRFLFIIRSTDYGLGKNKKDDSLYNAVEEVARGGTYMKERSNVHLRRFGLALNRIDGKDVYRQRTKFSIILNVL